MRKMSCIITKFLVLTLFAARYCLCVSLLKGFFAKQFFKAEISILSHKKNPQKFREHIFHKRSIRKAHFKAKFMEETSAFVSWTS